MKRICTIFLLTLASLSADELSSTNPIEPRIPLGAPLTGEQLKKVQETRYALDTKYKTQAKKLGITSKKAALAKSANLQPVYRIKSIGYSGKTLTFDNETIWEVSSRDAETVRNWAPGSYVTIVPNTHWFSSYSYRLENVSYGRSSAAVNLSEGPFKKYATFILEIDRMNSIVYLTDGSSWYIDTLNTWDCNAWRRGQAVLVGESRGWFGYTTGNILININENNYALSKAYR